MTDSRPALDAGKSALQMRALRRDGIAIAAIDKRADRYPVMKPLLQPVDSGYNSLDAGWHELDVLWANNGSSGLGVLKAEFLAGHYYQLSAEKMAGTADIWLVDSISGERVAHLRIDTLTSNPR